MTSVLAGLLAGLIHTFSGPDHLTAMAPLAVRARRKAWLGGLRWGLGHSAGIALVGLAALLLKELLPLETLSHWSDRIVGLLLVGLGFWSLRKALSRRLHSHAHTHEHGAHIHIHFHADTDAHDESAHTHSHAAFGLGTLHGLAGSAHFIGVLPALAFADIATGCSYLAAFGLGTVIAMITFATAVGYLAKRASALGLSAYRWLMGSAGVAALVTGVFWILL